MQENQDSLVYLDTGVIPVPVKTLHEISEFFGMPMGIITVSLDQMLQAVSSAVENLEERGNP